MNMMEYFEREVKKNKSHPNILDELIIYVCIIAYGEMITHARYDNSFHIEVMIITLSICFVGILRQHIILLTCCNEAILHNDILLTAENMG